jgi:cellulose synthase/poly-beta-1,6-N-acetylglucosamine synthase-like glycosyltransferase
MAAITFWLSLAVVTWIYVGYPCVLLLVSRARPRPRTRTSLLARVSVIVAAHDEEPLIGRKVENIRSSAYPETLLETVVVSDGSDDRTVERARSAGADVVIDLPRVGKLRALNEGVARSSGELLVFTDADSMLTSATLGELVSNFADPRVGAVAANEVHIDERGGGVARGEGMYWRYEQKIKQLEDRVGSAVSASGRLYAMRRDVFSPSAFTAGTDDFVVSTQAIRAGQRLAFDEHATVLVHAPSEGGTELRRKIRMMNRGLRAALALAVALPRSRTMYLIQLVFHKILRRFVAFFLAAMFVSALVLVAQGHARWWFALAPQLLFYALAAAGVIADRRGHHVPKLLWIPYYFCLSNLAAALAVLSVLRGRRYEIWEPALARSKAAVPGATR